MSQGSGCCDECGLERGGPENLGKAGCSSSRSSKSDPAEELDVLEIGGSLSSMFLLCKSPEKKCCEIFIPSTIKSQGRIFISWSTRKVVAGVSMYPCRCTRSASLLLLLSSFLSFLSALASLLGGHVLQRCLNVSATAGPCWLPARMACHLVAHSRGQSKHCCYKQN